MMIGVTMTSSAVEDPRSASPVRVGSVQESRTVIEKAALYSWAGRGERLDRGARLLIDGEVAERDHGQHVSVHGDDHSAGVPGDGDVPPGQQARRDLRQVGVAVCPADVGAAPVGGGRPGCGLQPPLARRAGRARSARTAPPPWLR